MFNRSLAVAIVFQNGSIILFVDGRIVHPNVDPERNTAVLAAEVAAHVSVLAAASEIKDAGVRAEIEGVVSKSIQAKAAELGR
jgi:hypothetical protein